MAYADVGLQNSNEPRIELRAHRRELPKLEEGKEACIGVKNCYTTTS
jgi:hypothetical protein